MLGGYACQDTGDAQQAQRLAAVAGKGAAAVVAGSCPPPATTTTRRDRRDRRDRREIENNVEVYRFVSVCHTYTTVNLPRCGKTAR